MLAMASLWSVWLKQLCTSMYPVSHLLNCSMGDVILSNIFHFLHPFTFFFFPKPVDSSQPPVVDVNLLSFFLCVSGTTAKHVVFLAGNTAKHGLRCKACKMSLHHKCETRVGMQQRCMGKLVRFTTQSHTSKRTQGAVRSL